MPPKPTVEMARTRDVVQAAIERVRIVDTPLNPKATRPEVEE